MSNRLAKKIRKETRRRIALTLNRVLDITKDLSFKERFVVALKILLKRKVEL